METQHPFRLGESLGQSMTELWTHPTSWVEMLTQTLTAYLILGASLSGSRTISTSVDDQSREYFPSSLSLLQHFAQSKPMPPAA